MIPIIGAAFEIGRELVDEWREGRRNKRKIKAAVAENKARLAVEKQTHNNKWEMMQLEDKDELLQRVSFFLLSAPFLIAIFDPQAVNQYFTVALSSVPEWYQYLYVGMLGGIWGIAESKKWKG